MWIEATPNRHMVRIILQQRDVASGRTEDCATIDLTVKQANSLCHAIKLAIGTATINAREVAEEAYKRAVEELRKAEENVERIKKEIEGQQML